MKKLIHRILFGKPGIYESYSPGDCQPRVMSTCEPDEKAGFNEVFQNVHRELRKAEATRLGLTN
jgi:hypothetical protein